MNYLYDYKHLCAFKLKYVLNMLKLFFPFYLCKRLLVLLIQTNTEGASPAAFVTVISWVDTSVSCSAYMEVLAQPLPGIPTVSSAKREFQAGNNLIVQQLKKESGDFSSFSCLTWKPAKNASSTCGQFERRQKKK